VTTERPRPSRRDENGFTVVELITCVVLMGIVVAPLTFALIQSLTLVPANKVRTESAIDRTFALNRFSDDVANAQAFFANVFPLPGEHVHACPPVTSDAVLAFPYWGLDGAIYRARFTPSDGATAVRVTRQAVTGGAAGTESDLLTGYCVPGDGQAPVEVHRIAPDPAGLAGPPSEYERLRLIVRLRARPDDPVEVIDLEATLRITP
jgi:hypothetical protein